jgi:hexosaminidase
VPVPIGQSEQEMTGENININLKSPVTGAKIYYTLDGTRPSAVSNELVSPLKVVVPAGKKLTMKTVVITPKGKQSVVTETVLNNAGK